jgi:hypothetical protein
MDKNLENAYHDVDHDLSTEWLALTERVRTLTHEIDSAAASDKTRLLLSDVSKLCDHVERLHVDVALLLKELSPEIEIEKSPEESVAIQNESIQIRREVHELRADFKDILKALFMWQDDPADRIREKSSL